MLVLQYAILGIQFAGDGGVVNEKNCSCMLMLRGFSIEDDSRLGEDE